MIFKRHPKSGVTRHSRHGTHTGPSWMPNGDRFSCRCDAYQLGFSGEVSRKSGDLISIDSTEIVRCITLPNRVEVDAGRRRHCTLRRFFSRARKLCDALSCPSHLSFNVNGATTGCTTIRPLLKHASPVTAGCEALRIRYPQFEGIGLARASRWTLPAAKRSRGLGSAAWVM